MAAPHRAVTGDELRRVLIVACDRCGGALDRFQPHRVITSAVEQLQGAAQTVLTTEATPVAFYHLDDCSPDVAELLGREADR